MWGCARRCCPNAPTMVYKCAWHSAGARGEPLPTQRIVPVLQTPAPRPAQEGTASVLGMLTPSRQTDSRPLWGRWAGRFRPGECAPHSFFSKRECAAPGGREKERCGSMRTLGGNLPGCFRLRSSSGAPMTLTPQLCRLCWIVGANRTAFRNSAAAAQWAEEERVCTCGQKPSTIARPSGSGARRTTGPLCTLRFAPNETNAA